MSVLVHSTRHWISSAVLLSFSLKNLPGGEKLDEHSLSSCFFVVVIRSELQGTSSAGQEAEKGNGRELHGVSILVCFIIICIFLLTMALLFFLDRVYLIAWRWILAAVGSHGFECNTNAI